MQWQRGSSCFLLYMIILFKFEVAILKIIYNMASSNNNLTLKVIGRMILPLALAFTSILLGTHIRKKIIYLPVKILPLVNDKL